mmetsp:Transcript_3089/g.5257  ORF Transcript_3089/g.5257 Transcript_3089/m.5257 type:complete len:247 (-) Transcript_3089:179-919(-)
MATAMGGSSTPLLAATTEGTAQGPTKWSGSPIQIAILKVFTRRALAMVTLARALEYTTLKSAATTEETALSSMNNIPVASTTTPHGLEMGSVMNTSRTPNCAVGMVGTAIRLTKCSGIRTRTAKAASPLAAWGMATATEVRTIPLDADGMEVTASRPMNSFGRHTPTAPTSSRHLLVTVTAMRGSMERDTTSPSAAMTAETASSLMSAIRIAKSAFPRGLEMVFATEWNTTSLSAGTTVGTVSSLV